MNKLTAERNQKLLLELAAKPGNDICADCKSRNPRWASWNIGIFVCMGCASIHRKIGTHVTKVKSLTMDTWTKEQVDHMRAMGNVNSNAIHNPNEARHPPPANLMDSERDSELESYIRSKYELKRFMNKGPSSRSTARASSSISSTSRSVSSPLAAPSTSTGSRFPSNLASNSGSPSQLPQRPPTIANTSSLPQPRLVSQPVSGLAKPGLSAVTKPTATPAKKPEGVWADLIGLDAPSGNSTLPLQIAAQSPLTAQHTSFSGMQLPNSINPYSQQSSPFTPSFTPSGSLLSQATQGSFMASQSFQMQPPMSAPGQGTTQFFQPYPQTPSFQAQAQVQMPLQIQVPTPGYQTQFMQNGLMSAPVGQPFMPMPSPSFISQTPQPPPSTTPTVGLGLGAGGGLPQYAMQGQGQFTNPTPPLQVPGTVNGFQGGAGGASAGVFQQGSQFGQGFGMNGMGGQTPMGMGQFSASPGQQPMYSSGFNSGRQWGAL